MAYFIQKETLTKIADSIRAKTNTTGKIDPLEMPSKINSIQTSGGDDGDGGVFVVSGEYSVASVVDNVLVVANGTPSGAASVITGPVGYMTVNGADVTASDNSLTFGG